MATVPLSLAFPSASVTTCGPLLLPLVVVEDALLLSPLVMEDALFATVAASEVGFPVATETTTQSWSGICVDGSSS